MADIKILAPFILSFEGGYSNHPADRGGATNKGVTIEVWKRQGYDKDGDGDIDVADLKLITDKDATDRIMKPHYWNRWKADRIKSQSVANIVVDWVWGSGKHGITKVQKLLGVTADGVVGEKTITALNAREPKLLFAEIKRERVKFIEGICRNNPTQTVFLKGWMRRLNGINYGSLTYNNGKTYTFKDV